MEARFFCRTGALAGAEYRIGGKATIGRGSSNTIVIADSVVSKTHARIAFDPATAAWALEDLDSTNGTWLDGAPVSGREPLHDLHVVTLGGRHDFIFVALSDEAGRVEGAPARSGAVAARPPDSPRVAAGARHERPSPPPGPPPVAGSSPASDDAGDSTEAETGTRYEPPPALSVPPLVSGPSPASDDAGDSTEAETGTRYEQPPALSVPPLVAGPSPASDDAGDSAAAEAGTRHEPPGVVFEVRPAGGEARRVRLGDGRHVFGREKGCAVPVDDRMLSRRHAAFAVRGEHVTVVDLDSMNGTFVDGTRIEAETEVGVGGIVGLGEAVTIVRVAP